MRVGYGRAEAVASLGHSQDAEYKDTTATLRGSLELRKVK